MLNSYNELFWGLASTLIAFSLGLLWRRGSQFMINHRARRFWKPLVGRELHVVLGRFREIDDFEASGVVGAGDHKAMVVLTKYFDQIGFKRFTTHYSDSYITDPANSRFIQGNLLLIGGPDANALVHAVIERMPLGLEFLHISRARLEAAQQQKDWESDETWRQSAMALLKKWLGVPEKWLIPVFFDKSAKNLLGPRLDGKEIRQDCAVIIRGPNPFNPKREVMIFAGCYGYGSWAAANYATSKEFLTRLPRRTHDIEVVLSVDVVLDSPQRPVVEIFRRLEGEIGLVRDLDVRVPSSVV